jgi:carboxyl-terminal processing protease
MKNMKSKIRNVIWLLWLATIVISSATCAFAARLQTPQLIENVSAVTGSASNESDVVSQACQLIDQGKFDDAGKLITQNSSGDPNRLDPTSRQLLQLVGGYDEISQKMIQDREESYTQRMAELDKLRTESDINDVNDITAALSAVANVIELADKQQKEKVLSSQFVKNVLQEAIDKASHFEVEGKWLEAYINCYAWLVVIDPNNEGYADYAQKIYDKATIKASLEDSACETREERYQGVDQQIFIETVRFLDRYYVNKIDYGQMAAKAIERCQLLAEVMEFPPEDLKKQDKNFKSDAEYRQALSAWSTTLKAIPDSNENSSTAMTLDKFLNMFETVLKLNETTIDLPQPLLIAHFAEASLSSLDDYTVIIWPRQVQEFDKLMTNEFSGIGIEISKPKGLLTVSSLLLDTPAFNSGLLDAGDVIEKVDGIETKDMTLTCAVKKITGPKGTKVTLTVRRPSKDKTIEDKIFDVILARGKIVVPTIRGWQRTDTGQWRYMIDPENRIGYVRITSFTSDTADDLETVLDELEEQGLKGLILDLRYNSGGLLESAIDVTDKFVKEGLIVQRQSGFGRLPIYANAKRWGTHPDYPLVVLVNSGSASASEIVAGALADKAHKRAILVGTRTHGKGSVQGITDSIGEGAQLKYTMAYYHLPSGQRVESREEMKKQGRSDWGVGPNVAVELSSDEIKNMIDVQRANDVLVRADHNDVEHKVEKYTRKETLATDYQLAVGLLVVKSKLVQAEAFAKSKSDS